MKNKAPSKTSSTSTVNSQLKLTIVSGLVVVILGLVAEYTAFQTSSISTTTIVVWCVIAAFSYLTMRYWLILGYGDSKSASELKLYTQLRKEVYRLGEFKDDVSVGQIYNEKVGALMDRVDQLYLDNDDQEASFGSRFFNLKTPKPIWTFASYDRSFLFAYIYTVATLCLVWVVTNQTGIVETALGLPDTDLPIRLLLITTIVIALIFLKLSEHLGDIHSWICCTSIFIGIFVFSIDANFVVYFIEGYTAALLLAGGWSIAFIFLLKDSNLPTGITVVNFASITPAIVVFSFIVAGANPVVYGAAFLIGSAVVLTITLLQYYLAEHKKFSGFVPVFQIIHLVFIFTLTGWLCASSGKIEFWYVVGPSILILLVLTIVNAPIDWLSLGVTRGLIRKGLELRGWMPALFGLIDLVVATILMVCLTACVLFAVQAFNTMTIIGGGEIFLIPTDYLVAFGDPEQRWKPQYYWVYIMLFSTMIPSMCNVVIGLMSISRGFAPLYRFIESQKIPTREAVPAANRMLFAPLIAFNRMVCVLGGLVLSILALYIIWTLILPLIGINLYTIALTLDEENYPTQFIIWVLTSMS